MVLGAHHIPYSDYLLTTIKQLFNMCILTWLMKCSHTCNHTRHVLLLTKMCKFSIGSFNNTIETFTTGKEISFVATCNLTLVRQLLFASVC